MAAEGEIRKPNLQQYFKECQEQGIFLHEVGATDNTHNVLFWIHPKGVEGNALNFSVKGNELTQDLISPEDNLRKYLHNVLEFYPIERLREILKFIGH